MFLLLVTILPMMCWAWSPLARFNRWIRKSTVATAVQSTVLPEYTEAQAAGSMVAQLQQINSTLKRITYAIRYQQLAAHNSAHHNNSQTNTNQAVSETTKPSLLSRTVSNLATVGAFLDGDIAVSVAAARFVDVGNQFEHINNTLQHLLNVLQGKQLDADRLRRNQPPSQSPTEIHRP